jgi:uncharacterized circularly permuted ATP-grasp superfamily protein/uncharacterized alpha-E superfamily protein
LDGTGGRGPETPPKPSRRQPVVSYEVLAKYKAWRQTGRLGDDSEVIRRRLLERFEAMPARELRALGYRVAATVRELGITSTGGETPGHRAHKSLGTDIVPFVFAQQEWDFISKGVSQRLLALDAFLRDIYGERHIFKDRMLPVDPILGSPMYQFPVAGLAPERAPYIHFGGLTLARDVKGEWLVKQHMIFEPTGVSGMLQNRRILARVASEAFTDLSVVSVAEAPWELLEKLRELSPRTDGVDPLVVLLTPGPASYAYAEHIFLGRRMGIPVVQGNELLVLHDKLYLKTVRGLRQVDVVLNRLRDAWLDPLVFRADSILGVPGLIHCVRKGTVALVNRPGSGLADDRALLPFTSTLIRYYLGQQPILKSVPSYWLGDRDQFDEVLADLGAYDVFPLAGGQPLGGGKSLGELTKSRLAKVRQEITQNAPGFVAQLRFPAEPAPCLVNGTIRNLPIDHRLYALRAGDEFEVIPGALTRAAEREGPRPDTGYALKDTWVINEQRGAPIWQNRASRARRATEHFREVTSKEAECFYWLGRYLERINILGYMLNVVDTMETEELSSAERRLYRPTWNRVLPPLVKGEKNRRRGLSTLENRYRLLMQPDEPGSVASMVERALMNGEEVQESITPLAWDTLMQLRQEFHARRYKPDQTAAELASQCSKLSEVVLRLVPQFFAICQDVSLLDDGWRFCSLGKFLERASTSANASSAMIETLRAQIMSPGWQQVRYDIELSAFLRMLSSRDAYYRVYQMRADPVSVLRILWNHPDAPRSVLFSLHRCNGILKPAPATVSERTVRHLTQLITDIENTEWEYYFAIRPEDTQDPDEAEGYNREKAQEMAERASQLGHHLESLLLRIMHTHDLVSDAFLTHQESISAATQV